MVIAELSYQGDYGDHHDAIVDCLRAEFPDLQHGHQGDSWIWIGEGENKISIANHGITVTYGVVIAMIITLGFGSI